MLLALQVVEIEVVLEVVVVVVVGSNAPMIVILVIACTHCLLVR